jgi:hypothetical protein
MLYDTTLHSYLLLFDNIFLTKNRDGSFGIALGYGLDDPASRVQFPAGAGNFSLHHRVQNGSGAHPASYSMGLPLGVKRPERKADHSPPSSAEVKERVELYFRSPNTPPWRGAQLRYRDTFTFTFTFNLHFQLTNSMEQSPS